MENGEEGVAVESVVVYRRVYQECSGDEASETRGLIGGRSKESLRNAPRPRRARWKVKRKAMKGRLGERVMVETIGQWHGDRRVNESVCKGWCACACACAWVELELELNQAWRSRMLPCQLDLLLHLAKLQRRHLRQNLLPSPPASGRRVGCGCTGNLGRKAPWLDTLTCNHFHVRKLRAPQVLCLSAPVLSPVPRQREEGKVTHISRVRSEQAHLNPSVRPVSQRWMILLSTADRPRVKPPTSAYHLDNRAAPICIHS